MREGKYPEAERDELALCFRVLGWLLLAADWLIVVFVPVSMKEGSTLWAWWFGIEALIGISLVVAGNILGEPVPLPAAAPKTNVQRVRAASAGQATATAS